MEAGQQVFQLDCPCSWQAWPVLAGPGPGHPIVGLLKHGAVVHAKLAARGGWLELPKKGGWIKAYDSARIQFLVAEKNATRELEFSSQESESSTDGLYGWHQVLLEPGLTEVVPSQFASLRISWCSMCGESLQASGRQPALRMGCGHAFHRHCLSSWPSSSICCACNLKCVPLSTPLPAPSKPTRPSPGTWHFSTLPFRLHHLLAVFLLTLLGMLLLRATHDVLLASAYTATPPLLRLLHGSYHTVCATPMFIINAVLGLPWTLCRAISWVFWTIFGLPQNSWRAIKVCLAWVKLPFRLAHTHRRVATGRRAATTGARYMHMGAAYVAKGCAAGRAAVGAFAEGYLQWWHAVFWQIADAAETLYWYVLTAWYVYSPDWLQQAVQPILGVVVSAAAAAWRGLQLLGSPAAWQEAAPLVASALRAWQRWTAGWSALQTATCLGGAVWGLAALGSFCATAL